MLRFILLNRKKTTGVQPPEGGAHTTHNHTTVLAKRLQLGKEPPSTTDHNNIRPRLALPPTKNGEALRQKVNQTWCFQNPQSTLFFSFPCKGSHQLFCTSAGDQRSDILFYGITHICHWADLTTQMHQLLTPTYQCVAVVVRSWPRPHEQYSQIIFFKW